MSKLESQFSLNFNRKRGRTSVKGTLNLRFIIIIIIGSSLLVPSQASLVRRPLERGKICRVAPTQANTWEEEEEEFITSGNWRGKHNSLSRGAGADQP